MTRVPRATYYATAPAAVGAAPSVPGKRGPKTALDDTALRALIRADLAASPFRGEGHRKVFGPCATSPATASAAPAACA